MSNGEAGHSPKRRGDDIKQRGRHYSFNVNVVWMIENQEERSQDTGIVISR